MQILKTSLGEMDLQSWLNTEYKKINNILHLIEKEFDTDMNSHPELRSYILDISNHIKRMQSYVEDGDTK